MEEILSKYFAGEASEEEKDQILEWRNASEQNAVIFLEAKKVWLSASAQAAADPSLLDQILEENNAFKIVPLWNQRLFQIAAVILIGLGIVFVVIRFQHDDQPFGQVVTEVTTLDLPDGSTVTLQRGASMTIGDFKTSREVILTGKAYFEVKKDEDKSFVVVTTGARVEVLGTSFVVNSNISQTTEVLVTSGTVTLAQNPEVFGGNSMKIRLEKGEMGQLTIGDKGIQKRKIEDPNYLAWKTRILTFRSSSMLEVSKVLSDVYGINVHLKDPALESCKLSAKFSEKKVEEVVDIIAQTFNFTYKKSDEGVIFMGSGCN